MQLRGLTSWWGQQLADLTSDRARILLVALGIVWGTLSLTIVVAFGSGFGDAMHRAMRASGDHNLRLRTGGTTRPFEGLPPGRTIRLRLEDAAAILKAVPAVTAVSVEYSSSDNPLRYAGARHNVRIHGVEPAFGPLRTFWPRRGGRFLNQLDEQERRRVAFLGDRLAREVFGDRDPVGEEILLRWLPFTVVGVMQTKVALGNYDGRDEDKVLIPASTFRVQRGWQNVSYIIAGVDDLSREREAVAGIYEVMGRRHRFHADDHPAINLDNMIENMSQAGFMVAGTRTMMGIVGVLGMLVALVGVANVMYVMVEERRREFGIQMALGARPGWILMQRVVEGVIVTVVGTVVGLAVSAIFLLAMNAMPMDEQARGYLGVPVVSIGLALLIASSLGIAGGLAGYIPARRAAAIQPVEALRED